MRLARAILLLAAAASATACAWSNPANRPVWNAFEAALVPEQPTNFALALPLTVPLGLGAIVADTFVAHPLQIADDAWHDAASLWRDLPWQEHYYTQAGFAPLRAVSTPALFALSFVGRSAFDLPTREAVEAVQRDREARREAAAAERHRRILIGLAAVAYGGDATTLVWPPTEWHEDFADPLAHALTAGSAEARLALLVTSVGSVAHAHIDWDAALRDESAVVRYGVCKAFVTSGQPLPNAALDSLRRDPDAAVRELAERWADR